MVSTMGDRKAKIGINYSDALSARPPFPRIQAVSIWRCLLPSVVARSPAQQSLRLFRTDYAGGAAQPPSPPYLRTVAKVVFDKVKRRLFETTGRLGDHESFILFDLRIQR